MILPTTPHFQSTPSTLTNSVLLTTEHEVGFILAVPPAPPASPSSSLIPCSLATPPPPLYLDDSSRFFIRLSLALISM